MHVRSSLMAFVGLPRDLRLVVLDTINLVCYYPPTWRGWWGRSSSASGRVGGASILFASEIQWSQLLILAIQLHFL